MKTIKIDIKRSDIDIELSKIAAYTGFKSSVEDPGKVYVRVSVGEEDASLLDRYWLNASGDLVEKLKDFVTTFDADANLISLTLEVSGAYDDSLTFSVREDVFSFILASMIARWFGITFTEKAAEWEREASRLLKDIERKLYHRRRPVRK